MTNPAANKYYAASGRSAFWEWAVSAFGWAG